jgi:hypothetical protein
MWPCRSRKENSRRPNLAMVNRYLRFLIAILSVSPSALSFSQCRPFSKSEVTLTSLAKRWTGLPPYPEGWSDGTDTSFWREVVPERRALAEAKLAKAKYVLLRDTEAAELTSGFKADRNGEKPYLVRAVAPFHGGKMFVRVRGTQVWVESGVLTHCDVPIERRPLAIWLKTTPAAVFVSFSAAQ